ncbi:hypothetical protein RhiirA5_416178 [Rhizophagus irregularis]|uniref:Uncharacterized protein n=1 Tax=Rhizophagus irregularis TaxID=588596 RepID=A0A2I1EKK4_9GLOM|nr:hypothetical protein RhiirA5_416178 [Rhizophagus irregularis]PKY22656.1 hypothetical protein RhiirB3_436667 [Rhizophagus irregularis]
MLSKIEDDESDAEDMLATQLVEEVEVKKELIPAFIPHSNKISTKEEIEEFDANNQKMANRLAKEDITKRVNKEELKERPRKFKVINGKD